MVSSTILAESRLLTSDLDTLTDNNGSFRYVPWQSRRTHREYAANLESQYGDIETWRRVAYGI